MYLSLWLCRAKKSDREAVLLHYASGNKVTNHLKRTKTMIGAKALS